MALGATVYVFTVRLADADRNIYETLELRMARHPSETAEFLFTRLLAYCLEYTEGIAFSKGLSDTEEPALSVRDLTGVLQTWIDIGLPEAARLHKASKAARRVVVYAHRGVQPWLDRLVGERIYRAADILVNVVDPGLLDALVQRLDRRMAFDLSVSERTLYVSIGEDTLTGAVHARALEPQD